ncbi:MAG: ribosomal protein S18-alanine N-acetyltransferase [Pseudomonadota bacterium]|nr:ribosomal protein S18-alanine N-acetyltransferase [Pseudomonadota bacterium]
MSAAVQSLTRIRSMLPADLKAIAIVEQASYKFPWSIGIFRDCMLAGYQGLVLDISGVIGGYAIMSIAAGEAHILNLCVHPEYQQMGYGGQLLGNILVEAERVGVERVFLEVRPSNEAAIKLYRSAGFEQIGVRPSYYQANGSREDAVIFAATLRDTQ